MCKVFLIPGIKQNRVKNAWKLVEHAAPIISKNDRDGFGYAAITQTGDVFGERWHNNEDAFKLNAENKVDKKIQEKFQDVFKATKVHLIDGDISLKDKAVGIIAHARMATCGRTMENTHPFFQPGKALVHNGVIRNDTQLFYKYDPERKLRTSTCDSEVILLGYNEYKVDQEPDSISKLSQDLTGYYAVGVLGSVNGKPYMDVFKDGAYLYATYVNELETFVYSTSKDQLESAIKSAGFTKRIVYEIMDNKLVRWDLLKPVEPALTIDFTASNKWTGGGNSNYSSEHYNTSATNNKSEHSVNKAISSTAKSESYRDSRHRDWSGSTWSSEHQAFLNKEGKIYSYELQKWIYPPGSLAAANAKKKSANELQEEIDREEIDRRLALSKISKSKEAPVQNTIEFSNTDMKDQLDKIISDHQIEHNKDATTGGSITDLLYNK